MQHMRKDPWDSALPSLALQEQGIPLGYPRHSVALELTKASRIHLFSEQGTEH